jgi:hypothetical protein
MTVSVRLKGVMSMEQSEIVSALEARVTELEEARKTNPSGFMGQRVGKAAPARYDGQMNAATKDLVGRLVAFAKRLRDIEV